MSLKHIKQAVNITFYIYTTFRKRHVCVGQCNLANQGRHKDGEGNYSGRSYIPLQLETYRSFTAHSDTKQVGGFAEVSQTSLYRVPEYAAMQLDKFQIWR